MGNSPLPAWGVVVDGSHLGWGAVGKTDGEARTVHKQSVVVHIGWWSLRVDAGSVSTRDPHMGIAVRMTQNGHYCAYCPQDNPQPSSTSGEILGISASSGTSEQPVTHVTVASADDAVLPSHRPWLGLDATGEVGHLVEQRSTLGHQLTDLAVGVHDGRVITAAEGLSDLR